MSALPSRPHARFASATVTRIEESRNRVTADVKVASGSDPALIKFSRPFFNGYKASLGSKELPVTSDRGLYPVVEIPAGSRGRLSLFYRPAWLVYGGAVAGLCAVLWLAGLIAVGRRRK